AEAFREIAADTTILLVEQNFNFARSLGTDMAVIDDGRVVHHGKMADFAADTDLQGQLLGLSV
ncbi:MAG: ABC transporter ATP-binding protein, partial [Sulfitobacter sp.]|nr:ABC transporter ATP-binding protein [Sulfitobacter sp.]